MPRSDALVRQLDTLLNRVPPGGEAVTPTGFDGIDALLGGGLRAGQVTSVGGTTGIGASLFALGIARRAALDQKIATYYLATESSTPEIHARIIAAEALVSVERVRAGTLNDDERARVARQRERLGAADLLVGADWAGPVSADSMAGSVDGLAESGCGFIVVDDTWAAEPSTRGLVRSLRRTAQTHRTSILVVSTFVKPPDRISEQPRLEDLREYTATADLFDVVISLHRPDMHDCASPRPGEVDVEILKNRYGPTQLATIAFQGHYARFVDIRTTAMVQDAR